MAVAEHPQRGKKEKGKKKCFPMEILWGNGNSLGVFCGRVSVCIPGLGLLSSSPLPPTTGGESAVLANLSLIS